MDATHGADTVMVGRSDDDNERGGTGFVILGEDEAISVKDSTQADGKCTK